jgi:hypothetical protein
MGLKSSSGGSKTSATISRVSPKAKADISFVSRMLTPSERALVKRDLRDTIETASKTKTK